MIKELKKSTRQREWYYKNREKMRKYHREYMRKSREKKRVEKLAEQRKNPTWWIFIEKDYGFRQKILTSK